MHTVEISDVLWEMFVRQLADEIVLLDGFWLKTKMGCLLQLLRQVYFLHSISIPCCILLRAHSLPHKRHALLFLHELCFKMLKVLLIDIQALDIFCLLDGHVVSWVEKTKVHLVLLVSVAWLSGLAVLGLPLKCRSLSRSLRCR